MSKTERKSSIFPAITNIRIYVQKIFPSAFAVLTRNGSRFNHHLLIQSGSFFHQSKAKHKPTTTPSKKLTTNSRQHNNKTMFSRRLISSTLIIVAIAATLSSTNAFTANGIQARARVSSSSQTTLSAFGKKPVEDLSDIEVRDLTRAEMLEINKRNEEVMNRELQAMTGISVLFSIPILYLCWVAFFSD
jgi:hypothetical protein